ncbi:MAG: ABC transporter permease subunit [Acetatifactor sp.]|nr:ABC transporter permease subunit [Acetatifactor sp.]
MRAFLRKEWMEVCRTGRLLILLLIFTLLGIMNPAMAKLMPWLMEMSSASLADAGLIITAVTVDAMTSWEQFYKNIPIGLIIFILISSGSFTDEYQKGTLIPVVTKGLSRRKIVLAKALMIFALWTALYLLCIGITYGYNAYFWDNSIAHHPFFAAALAWLFGVWVIALLVVFSTVARNGTQVLLGVGGVVLGGYILSMFPKLSRFLPIKLMNGMSLLQGADHPEDYYAGMAVVGLMVFLGMVLAAVFFDRKRL